MSSAPGSPLTVIIPTWNRKDLLRRCLASLERQTVDCPVLVVDDGSTDGTAEMLAREFPRVSCLRREKNEGFVRAVNAGIQHSGTPWLALLNNDTEADPHWLEWGLQALQQEPQFAFFACRIVQFFDRDRLDSAGDCYSRTGLPYKRGLGRPLEEYRYREPVLGASAGAAFYRRTLFDRVGLFDEDFVMYLEDVEFSLRAQLAGFRCLYLPEAVVYHIEAASDSERRLDKESVAAGSFYSARRVYWITRNRWQLMVLYQPVRHLPWLTYGWIKSALFHLLRAGFTGSFLRGVGAGLLLTPRALRKRRSRKPVLTTRELCRLIRQC